MRRRALAGLAIAVAVALTGAVPAHAQRASVTVSEGTNMAVTASPGGGDIVMDLQGKLFSLPRAGGAARAFSDDFLDPFWPDLSPDGARVAVQSYADGMFHIWTIEPDGDDPRQLTFGNHDDIQPAWSPDGNRIAFASARAGGNDIWTVDATTGVLRRITTAAAAETQPTWSPDGKRIAYVRGNLIESIDLATGAVATVVPDAPGAVAAPSWSPDGQRIAFLRARRLTVSFAPGQETPVGTLEDVFAFPPQWLSDDELLYAANGKIVISDLAGAARQVPFEATFQLQRPSFRPKRYDFDSRRDQPVKGIVGPALSPDGRTAVFKALNDLWLLPIGGSPRRLTNDDYYEVDPVWSRDGERIAYASDKAGTEDLYVLDVRTRRERRVTTTDGAEVSPAWSPDGRTLAFQDHDGQTHTVDLASGATTRVLAGRSAPGRPSWSADGKVLALSVSSGQRNQIELVDVQAKTSRVVEPAPFRSVSTRGDDGPAWSPDGRWMAFTMESTLWVLPVTPAGDPAGPARQVTRHVAEAPSWSDSRTLLYLHYGKLKMISRDGSWSRDVPTRLDFEREQPHGRVTIHAGRLWDGANARVQRDVDITVVRNRIRDIRPHKRKRHRGRFIDASHLTVVPGLIDMHHHQHLRSKFFGDRQGRLLLSYGITATRSTGDQMYRALEDREALDAGLRAGPRFFYTGEMLEGSRLSWDFARPVMDEDQLDLELDRARQMDFDMIKTYQRFRHDWQARVAAEGRAMGILTSSHYLYPGVAHGVGMQEHLSGPTRWGFGFSRNSSQGNVYEDVVQTFGRSKMPLTTTMFGSSALLADDPGLVDDPRVKTLYTTSELETLRAELVCAQGGPCTGGLGPSAEGTRRQVSVFKRIKDAGGTVVAGTDAPLDNTTVSLHFNLRAMAKFGFTPFETLRTATADAARVLGVEDDLGTVEPGKLADLVLVGGDPSANISDLADVAMVMKNGRTHTVNQLLAPFGP